MTDDFDDILGGSAPAPVKDTLPFASGGKDFRRSMSAVGASRALKGAPAGWYSALLGISVATVKRKLEGVIDPKHVSADRTKYYDPREALPYLIVPHDLKRQLALMNPKDLPERLRKDYWTARRAEQDVRERARDLWRSDDVHKVLGDLMKLIKNTVTLWTDDIDEAVGLNTEQVEILDNLIRALLASIGESIEEYAAKGVTPSQEIEFDDNDEL